MHIVCVNQAESESETDKALAKIAEYNKEKDWVFIVEEDDEEEENETKDKEREDKKEGEKKKKGEVRVKDMTEDWAEYTFEPVAAYLDSKKK